MLTYALTTAIQAVTDAPPEPADVKAGWTAFAIFLAMFAAVVLLGFSMSRQFKKARQNRDAGVLPTIEDRKPADRNSGTA